MDFVFLLFMAFAAVLGWALDRVGGEAPRASVRVDIVDLDDTPASAHFAERLTATNATLLLCANTPISFWARFKSA